MQSDNVNIDNDASLLPLQTATGGELPQLLFAPAPGTSFVSSLAGLSGNIVLAGGTTGFSYSAGSGVITLLGPLSAKGDLYTFNGSAGIRLPVSTDAYVLTADSAQATGLKWAPSSSVIAIPAGAIPFGNAAGTGIDTDVTHLFWDDTNNFFGKGTNVPTVDMDIVSANASTDVKIRDGSRTLELSSTFTGTSSGLGTTTNTPLVIATNSLPAITLSIAQLVRFNAYGAGAISSDASGNLTAGTLSAANGGTGITALGTGVPTALGVNVGSVGAFVVNGGALGTPISGNGSNLTGITATQVGLGNVTNDAQTKEAIVPNTAPSAGQILVGNAGNTAYAKQTLSGSGATVSLASTGVLTISGILNASLANSSITINGTSAALGGTRTLVLASADFVNQGTATTVLHGNAAGNPTFAAVSLTTDVTGTLPEGSGGTNQSTYAQGDLLYASAANTLSKLAKNASATRYLSNTGTSNNPAWAQVDLTNGVTGTLPAGSGGTGITSLGTGIATWLGTPSSANLATAITDETGTGVLVFATAPTFTTSIAIGGAQDPGWFLNSNSANASARNWGSFTNFNAFGDWVLNQSNALGGSPYSAGTTRISVGPSGGFVVGAPTGGEKGAGTANFAADIYKNNTAYTNPHGGFEYAYTGRVIRYADRMAAMGLPDYKPLGLAELEQYTRKHFHFPYMGDEAENGLFSGGERLLLITEELAVHLFDLARRVERLERSIHS